MLRHSIQAGMLRGSGRRLQEAVDAACEHHLGHAVAGKDGGKLHGGAPHKMHGAAQRAGRRPQGQLEAAIIPAHGGARGNARKRGEHRVQHLAQVTPPPTFTSRCSWTSAARSEPSAVEHEQPGRQSPRPNWPGAVLQRLAKRSQPASSHPTIAPCPMLHRILRPADGAGLTPEAWQCQHLRADCRETLASMDLITA